MKKLCSVSLAVFFTALCLFANGAKDGNVSDELIINSYHSDEISQKAFGELVADFKAKNPGIKVTVNTTAHEQFKTLLPSWLTSNRAPDVATWFAGYRMQSFAEKGLLEPLTDDIFPGGSFEKEFPKSFKGAASYNGSVYFLPQAWYWWALYYNKAVFAKYGLKTPKTWNEFLQICQTLKANGVAPISIGTKETWTAGGWFDYIDSAVNGGDFHRNAVDRKSVV